MQQELACGEAALTEERALLANKQHRLAELKKKHAALYGGK